MFGLNFEYEWRYFTFLARKKNPETRTFSNSFADKIRTAFFHCYYLFIFYVNHVHIIALQHSFYTSTTIRSMICPFFQVGKERIDPSSGVHVAFGWCQCLFNIHWLVPHVSCPVVLEFVGQLTEGAAWAQKRANGILAGVTLDRISGRIKCVDQSQSCFFFKFIFRMEPLIPISGVSAWHTVML